MNQKNRSEETQQRIRSLKKILKQYEENIALLQDFAEGRLTLKNKCYSFGAENYKRTVFDEQRLVWTLNHLKTQMQFYQHELEGLQK